MSYAISLLFDEKTISLVRAYWESAFYEGISSISYASNIEPVMPIIDIIKTDHARMKALIQSFAGHKEAFYLHFKLSGLHTLPPASLYWIGSATIELLDLKQKLLSKCSDFSETNEKINSDSTHWFAGLKLVSEIQERKIIPAMIKTTQIFPEHHIGKVTGIGFNLIDPFKILFRYDFLTGKTQN